MNMEDLTVLLFSPNVAIKLRGGGRVLHSSCKPLFH